MKNRRLGHRSFVRRPLALEQLQQRVVLTGNVSAYVDRGTLFINGDIGDNQLRISSVGKDWVQIAALDGTTINNQQSVATFKVTKGYVINMGGGNDVLQFENVKIRSKNDLVVDMGVGDDNLQFNNVDVLRIRALLGEGHDTVSVTNSKVERSLNIFGGGGDDQLTLANSRFGEKSVIDGNDGANFLQTFNVKWGRKLQQLNLAFGLRPTTPTNPAVTPIAANTDNFTVARGQANAILNILANDTPTTGHTLNISTLQILQGPTNGVYYINPDGSLAYTHNGSETTSDTIRYRISDTSGASADGLVNITITASSMAPIAANDSASVATGATITIPVATNDYDPDGALNPASIVIVSHPTNGQAVANSDGTVTYTHNGADSTSDSFTYTIKDLDGNVSQVATVTIEVVTNNPPPVANDDEATVAEGGNVIINYAVNDSDSNGTIDYTTAVIVQQPAHGTVTINNNGTFTYLHNGSETTSDTFTYTVRDNLGTISNVATVTITITPVNDFPIAVGDSASVPRGGTVTIDVAANDSDPEDDLDLASIVIVAQPAHGTVTVNDDGTVTYVHDGSEGASDSFTYNIKDGEGAVSATVTVNITITTDNLPPVANDDEATVDEGGTTTVSVLANDEDPEQEIDASSVTIVDQPAHGSVVVADTGAIIYTHDGSETTTDTFTYTVKDQNGVVSNVATVTITINPVNDDPLAANDSQAVVRGSTATINVAANDSDPEGELDLASIEIVDQPEHGTITVNDDGTVTYVHDGSEADSDSFTYTIKDASGAVSAVATVTLTINDENQPPVANDDTATVDEGGEVTINVAANDSDPENELDVSFIVISAPPAHGSVVVNGDGTVTYTHDGSETTSDSFTYTIRDAAGLVSNIATVEITINPVNDAPVAADDAATVPAGDSIVISLLDNDADADDEIDPASIIIVTEPEHGTVVINDDGTVTYTHDGGEATSDTFTYTVADATGAVSNVATVMINIAHGDPPVAVDDSADVDEGGMVIIPVASNDTDEDSELDLTSIVIVDQPSHGTVVVNGDGSVTYTHDGSETLTDSFTYTIKDQEGLTSNTATVTINVAPVNDPAVAQDDVGEVAKGESVTLDLAANDSDADGTLDLTSIAIVSPPAHGTVVINDDGSVTYTHDGSETLSDSFTYTISDNNGAVSNVATVTLTITGVNDPPVAADDSADVDEGGTVVISVAANDTDPNDNLDLTTLEIVDQPEHGTVVVNDDGTVTYTHDGSETTSDSFTYTIKDAFGEVSNVATVTINVAPVNDPPVANDDAAEVEEGGTVQIPVGLNDYDVDGILDLTSIEIADLPQHGTVSVTPEGQVVYTHDGSETTTDTFTYTIKDAEGAVSGVATVTVTITPANQPPVANDDAAEVDEGASVEIPVTANDSDPDDGLDLATLEITEQPQHGTLTVNEDGTVIYLHDGSETTSDSFTYTIKDASGAVSNTATVTITIVPVNDAPIAEDDEVQVTEDSGVVASGNLLDNDSDPEGSPLSIAAVDGLLGNVGVDVDGFYGTFHINADGTFTYTLDDSNPAVDALEDLDEIIDAIVYSVTDGELSSTATLTVRIFGKTD